MIDATGAGVPMISHERRINDNEAFGDGTCEAYAGTAAHNAADGSASVLHTS